MSRRCQRDQRGAVAVIVVIIFLVLVGYAAITSSILVTTGMNEASMGDSSTKAELLARSGLERAFYLLKNNTACTSVGTDLVQNYNGGTFDITGGTSGTNGCQVTVLAQVGTLTRTLTGTINTTFWEPFDPNFATTWATTSYTATRGADSYDSANNCIVSVCPGSLNGSYYMYSGTTGASDTFAGYRQRTMPTIATGGGGATVAWSLGWRKNYLNTGAFNGNVNTQTLTLSLVDSAAGVVTQVWTNTTLSNANTWASASGSITLAANRNYDQVRVTFNLVGTAKARVEEWIDEIRLTKQ